MTWRSCVGQDSLRQLNCALNLTKPFFFIQQQVLETNKIMQMWTAGNTCVFVSSIATIMREKECGPKLKAKRTQTKHSAYLHASF
jgi:hypothetical protein